MKTKIIILFFVMCASSWGAPLPEPDGKPVLIISGKIKNINKNGVAAFHLMGLETLGLVTLRTRTPWFYGQTTLRAFP